MRISCMSRERAEEKEVGEEEEVGVGVGVGWWGRQLDHMFRRLRERCCWN